MKTYTFQVVAALSLAGERKVTETTSVPLTGFFSIMVLSGLSREFRARDDSRRIRRRQRTGTGLLFRSAHGLTCNRATTRAFEPGHRPRGQRCVDTAFSTPWPKTLLFFAFLPLAACSRDPSIRRLPGTPRVVLVTMYTLRRDRNQVSTHDIIPNQYRAQEEQHTDTVQDHRAHPS